MKINSETIGNLFTNLFLCLIGFVIAVPTAYKAYDSICFERQSSAVEGVVTDAGCSSFFGCKPFIKYVDANDQVHEFRSKVNFYFFASPKKGDKIRVYFLKKDYRTARIGSIFYNIIQPLCFCLIGSSVITVVIFRAMKPTSQTI